MKYFPKEFHKADNNPRLSRKTVRRIDKAYLRNLKAYYHALQKLSGRLPVSAWRFFRPGPRFESLHDATLLSFEVGDAMTAPSNGKSFNPRKFKHSVKVRFLNYERDRLYTFRYHGVVAVTFDFPSSDPLHYTRGSKIGDQLVDEIVALDDRTLRHEHFFESGAELRIDFERLATTVSRLKK